ncbi:hypothetical protein O181_017456 [Austropuccinia psidii MF-1]|uniref:Uncharacterized protein n=1 Tax=Austropuccinia psidii MF-1 TaxID=1389203 RepID=A0A9Q3C7M2_9BASI|nr:hypothetical protein [Austropuccinia psidii MF-1]
MDSSPGDDGSDSGASLAFNLHQNNIVAFKNGRKAIAILWRERVSQSKNTVGFLNAALASNRNPLGFKTELVLRLLGFLPKSSCRKNLAQGVKRVETNSDVKSYTIRATSVTFRNYQMTCEPSYGSGMYSVQDSKRETRNLEALTRQSKR